MRDAERFTVDDPRFSTAQVVGPSMLSLDGDEHRRHRDPFAEAFLRPEARSRFAGRSTPTPADSWPDCAGRQAEIRRDLAGPLAVAVVAARPRARRHGARRRPGLVRRDRGRRRSGLDRWRGRPGGPRGGARSLGATSRATIERGGGMLAAATDTLGAGRGRVERRGDDVRRHRDQRGHDDLAVLAPAEPIPDQLGAVRADRTLARTPSRNRCAWSRPPRGSIGTRRTTWSSAARRSAGRPRHRVADRRPTATPRRSPTRTRSTSRDRTRRSHLAFAQGPARLHRRAPRAARDAAALDAVLDGWPGLALDRGSTPPTGVIFSKPQVAPRPLGGVARRVSSGRTRWRAAPACAARRPR